MGEEGAVPEWAVALQASIDAVQRQGVEIKDALTKRMEALDTKQASLEQELKREKLERVRWQEKAVEQMVKMDAWMERMEAQDRRENMIVSGVVEETEESWKETEEKVRKVVDGMKEGLGSSIEIQRCHRLGRYNPVANFPRRIIVKLVRYKEKEAIFALRSSLRGSEVYLDDDLPAAMRIRRDSLRRFAKPLSRERGVPFVLKYPYHQVLVGKECFHGHRPSRP
jgi:hypothetical protein